MKSYVVGGWVRDKVMGQPSSDKDWVVVGSTEKELLDKGFIQVGASFPVFLHPETKQEYALARKEVKTGQGYHGFRVDFDENVTLDEDLLRRDLTINAIAWDPETQTTVDPFGGLADIESKILKNVSPAFVEDPLRVIRLARFHSLFSDFTISDELLSFVKTIVQNGEMKTLAKERIVREFEKAHCQRAHVSLFWKHCLDWEVCTQVFNVSPVSWNQFERLFQTYYHQCSYQDDRHRLCLALTLYQISLKSHKVSDGQNLLKCFSKKVQRFVKLMIETYELKESWTIDSFVEFIIRNRLTHLTTPRYYCFDCFSLPLSDQQVHQLLVSIDAADKSAIINSELETSAKEQMIQYYRNLILNGQFKDSFS